VSDLIILKGNPLSTSHIYKSFRNRVYLSKQGKDLKQSYIEQAQEQWTKEVIECDVSVSVEFYFGDRRRRDIDNYNKLVLDSLNDIVWVDDVQIQELGLKKFYDKENPRTEVLIKKTATKA